MHKNNGTLVRYVAVLLVVIQHAFLLTGHPDPLGRFGAWWTGHIGVLMFFALSGYLLYPRAQNDPLTHFIRSRVLRIYPLLLTVNFLVVLLGWIQTTLPATEYFDQGAWRFLYKNIFNFGQISLPGTSVTEAAAAGDQANASLWSIYYELRAYLLLALMACLGVLGNRAVMAALVLVAVLLEPSKTLLHFGDPRAYHVTLAFLFGCLIASQGWKPNTGHIVLAICVGLLTFRLRNSWPIASVLMTFCLCVATVGSAFGRVPYAKFFDRLPDLTYGVFLTHWPILLVLIPVWPRQWEPLLICGLILSLAISVPLHFWIEEPARRLKLRRWTPVPAQRGR